MWRLRKRHKVHSLLITFLYRIICSSEFCDKGSSRSLLYNWNWHLTVHSPNHWRQMHTETLTWVTTRMRKLLSLFITALFLPTRLFLELFASWVSRLCNFWSSCLLQAFAIFNAIHNAHEQTFKITRRGARPVAAETTVFDSWMKSLYR